MPQKTLNSLIEELTVKLGKRSLAINKIATLFKVSANMVWKYANKGTKPNVWVMDVARKNGISEWWIKPDQNGAENGIANKEGPSNIG